MLKKVLELCEVRGFLKSFKDGLKLVGPVGALLRRNLETEWFYNLVINRETSVFMNEGSFVDTYEFARRVCQERSPFGVAEVVKDTEDLFDLDGHFFHKPRYLLTTVFVPPSLSTQFFHDWQRLRRTWWRKLSAYPGRYAFSDLQTNGDSQLLQIRAEYESEKVLVESLRFNQEPHPLLTPEQLFVRDGRKKVQAHYISSNISLDNMLLNCIWDAYDEPDFIGKPRPLLRFHRKLAPYKISFAISATKSSTLEELSSLALYLCRKLRDGHVSCLLLPMTIKTTLESQWAPYDEMGVPYTVILNETTLKNGISLLRSRDTTLKEQVHVTKLPAYVEQLFKNY
ncbi:DNA polymerase subunit gamma-2, mitochondrial [Photinus pyralis]|nr:DNA polymerase subunit gamma-2, mitochondrial [Photinus pyralis]